MTKRTIRNILTVLILVLTLGLFIRYFTTHPEYWDALKEVSRWTLIWVVVFDALMLGALVFIYDATIRLCGKRLGKRENFLLTAYSSIANFFGPLQSGPGVRAAYLKTKHKVRLRDYTLATLLYYAIFAFFSAFFLLVGTRPWWQTALALLAVAGFSAFVVRFFKQRDKKQTESQFHLSRNVLAALIIFTFLQVLLTAGRYYIELHAVNPSISVGQAVSYAGAANFALFVSITPDAVGIREAFLVFSQNLHHVSTGDILSANLIDRASYLIFLGILAIVVASMHAKEKLGLPALRLKPSKQPKI